MQHLGFLPWWVQVLHLGELSWCKGGAFRDYVRFHQSTCSCKHTHLVNATASWFHDRFLSCPEASHRRDSWSMHTQLSRLYARDPTKTLSYKCLSYAQESLCMPRQLLGLRNRTLHVAQWCLLSLTLLKVQFSQHYLNIKSALYQVLSDCPYTTTPHATPSLDHSMRRK